METASFPPLDDIILRLSQVAWRKHWNDFIIFVATVCAICVAVVSYFARRIGAWYQSGGKDDLLLFSIKCRKIAGVCYHWFIDSFIPEVVTIYHEVVTVAKVAQGHLR